MSSARRQKALLIVVLFALTLVVPRVSMIPPRAATLSQSNWVVLGTQVAQNESITLNGNLTIEKGGNLTLRNVNLMINGKYDGEYGILVEAGASLYIYGSSITSENFTSRYTFETDKGSTFVMVGSKLEAVGWCGAAQTGSGTTCETGSTSQFGPLIESDGALIQGNLITGNNIGLILLGSYDRVVENNITANDQVSINMWGGYPTHDYVEGNYFSLSVDSDTWQINAAGQDNTFLNNTFTSVRYPPRAGGGGLGYASSTGGFTVVGGSGFMFENNTFSSEEQFLLFGTSNSTISGNTIVTDGDTAVTIYSGSGDVVTDNTMQLIPKLDYTSVAGISLGNTVNDTVAGNLIYGNGTFDGNPDLGPAIMFTHVSHSYIQNNFVSLVSNAPSLQLMGSDNNLIEGNTLYNGAQGIFAYASSNDNVISDNYASANDTYIAGLDPQHSTMKSIIVDASSNNEVYGNDFHDSFSAPYDGGINDSWTVDGEGNYWSPTSGNQTFKIAPNGVDLHPLQTRAQIIPKTVTIIQYVPPKQPSAAVSIAASNDTTIVNKDITGKVQLSVTGTGTLTIDNSTIDMLSGMQVAPGATLIIKDSRIFGGGGQIQGNLTMEDSNLLLGQVTNSLFDFSGSVLLNHTTISVISNGFGFEFRNQGGDGASLTILDSNLTGGAGINTDAMIEDDGGNLRIENSYLEGVQSVIDGNLLSSAVVVNDTIPSLGVSLNEVNNTLVSGNKIDGPISVMGIENITVSGNNIAGGWSWGIEVFASNSVVTGNFVTNIRATSAFTVRGTGDYIAGNQISNSSVGIGVIGSDNVFNGNIIENVAGGFGDGGNSSLVMGNTFINSGIYLGGSNDTIYHNNFIGNGLPVISDANNTFSLNGEGNYWSSYLGKDDNLDGIGDTLFMINGIVDNYPFMKPNGWLTKFFLTVQTNLTGISRFQMNGSSFGTGSNGEGSYRLGYNASYIFTFPQVVTLPNGTSYNFAGWSDGFSGTTRTIPISSNSTIEVLYVMQNQRQVIGTSSTSIASSTSGSSSSFTLSSSSSSNTSSSNGGGVPEFPYSVLIVSIFMIVVVGAYVFLRRRPSKRNPAN